MLRIDHTKILRVMIISNRVRRESKQLLKLYLDLSKKQANALNFIEYHRTVLKYPNRIGDRAKDLTSDYTCFNEGIYNVNKKFCKIYACSSSCLPIQNGHTTPHVRPELRIFRSGRVGGYSTLPA